MTDGTISLISEELSKAGQDATELALLERLEKRRITPDTEIPPMQFLFQMFCKPCFPRGELVAVAGKAKSGKTFVSSMLMALCFREEVLTVRRLEEETLSVLWFDTEQSEESTQDILKNRILKMIEASTVPHQKGEIADIFDEEYHTPDSSLWERLGEAFHIFNVRADFWQERLPLLEAAMRRFHPDLVILDGIRDLVNDINDGVMAQDVIERLMHLASEQRCCIVCILHQNKGAEDKNLRGWIGTELKNKAFEVYECTKDADRIFTWSQTDTRKYDIVDKLKYVVDESGIPQLCSVEQLIENQGSSPSSLDTRPALNPKYLLGYDGKIAQLNIEALFTDAFRPGEQKSAAALQATIMSMANITSYRFYNRRREEAIAQGIIVQSKDENGHIIYSCPSKQSPN
ncbi:MAG: AAA family ATPase [Prevotellaceae bacterium]|nr:AAA family ATPase [Candidatus Minthosoma equi]